MNDTEVILLLIGGSYSSLVGLMSRFLLKKLRILTTGGEKEK